MRKSAWFHFSVIILSLAFIACGSEEKATPAPEPAITQSATTDSLPASITAPPQLILSVHQGAVDHQTAGIGDWTRGVEGMTLEVQDHVKTLAFSTAVIHFADGSRVKLHPNTELAVDVFTLKDGGPPDGHRISKVRIVNGGIDFDIAEAHSDESIWQFIAEDGVVAIQGTAGTLISTKTPTDSTYQEYETTITKPDGTTVIIVTEETVKTAADGTTTTTTNDRDADDTGSMVRTVTVVNPDGSTTTKTETQQTRNGSSEGTDPSGGDINTSGSSGAGTIARTQEFKTTTKNDDGTVTTTIATQDAKGTVATTTETIDDAGPGDSDTNDIGFRFDAIESWNSAEGVPSIVKLTSASNNASGAVMENRFELNLLDGEASLVHVDKETKSIVPLKVTPGTVFKKETESRELITPSTGVDPTDETQKDLLEKTAAIRESQQALLMAASIILTDKDATQLAIDGDFDLALKDAISSADEKGVIEVNAFVAQVGEASGIGAPVGGDIGSTGGVESIDNSTPDLNVKPVDGDIGSVGVNNLDWNANLGSVVNGFDLRQPGNLFLQVSVSIPMAESGELTKSLDKDVAGITGKPDQVQDLTNKLIEGMERPSDKIFYDSGADPILKQKPDEVLFKEDANGQQIPVGIIPGAWVVLDTEGEEDKDRPIASVLEETVIYKANLSDSDNLIATNVLAEMPRLSTGQDGVFQAASAHVMIDDKGNVVAAYLTDEDGDGKLEYKPLPDDLTGADGQMVDICGNALVECNDEGKPDGQVDVPYYVVDENGEKDRYIQESPILSNGEGEPVAWVPPTTYVVTDEGISDVIATGPVTKEAAANGYKPGEEIPQDFVADAIVYYKQDGEVVEHSDVVHIQGEIKFEDTVVCPDGGCVQLMPLPPIPPDGISDDGDGSGPPPLPPIPLDGNLADRDGLEPPPIPPNPFDGGPGDGDGSGSPPIPPNPFDAGPGSGDGSGPPPIPPNPFDGGPGDVEDGSRPPLPEGKEGGPMGEDGFDPLPPISGAARPPGDRPPGDNPPGDQPPGEMPGAGDMAPEGRPEGDNPPGDQPPGEMPGGGAGEKAPAPGPGPAPAPAPGPAPAPAPAPAPPGAEPESPPEAEPGPPPPERPAD